MQRETLLAILEAAPSVTRDGDAFVFDPEHRATLYLARPGHTTSLSDLVRVEPRAAYLRAEAKDRTVHFVVVEEIAGLSVRPPRDASTPAARTGF